MPGPSHMQARARFPLIKEKNGNPCNSTQDVTWRASQRGLVVCAPGGETLLVEHARATMLPDLIGAASDVEELALSLGGSEKDHELARDLVAEHIIADPDAPHRDLVADPHGGWCSPAPGSSSPASHPSHARYTGS